MQDFILIQIPDIPALSHNDARFQTGIWHLNILLKNVYYNNLYYREIWPFHLNRPWGAVQIELCPWK